MMSPELIRDISNVAAYRAAQEGRTPIVPWRDSVAEDVRHAPFLGEYVPAGWRLADWAHLPATPRRSAIPWSSDGAAIVMVDSSGLGRDGEPALTFPEVVSLTRFLIASKVDFGLGIIEAGQFQIVLGVYLRDRYATGTPAPSEESVTCDECGTVHDGLEECAETDDDESFDEYVARCPACGDVIDYCQGHGEIGDPAGAAILVAHDSGNHRDCHPEGCEDAGPVLHSPGQITVEAMLECDDCGRTDGTHDYEVEH